MRLELCCRACGTATVSGDVDDLSRLSCAQCGATAEARASEDLGSAVEDALSQLWRVSETFELSVSLSTAEIPEAFRPPPDDS